MDMLVPFIFFIIVGILFWLGAVYFEEKAVLRRKIHRIPQGNIMTCKDGDKIRLTGEVEKYQKTLIAPLSKRMCVYYKVIVEKRTSSRNSGGNWTTIIHDEKAVNFFICVDSKKALVSTWNVRSFLAEDAEYSSGFLNDAKPFLEEYMHRHGHSTTGWFGLNDTIRYHESRLEIGNLVTVAGTAGWRPAKELSLPNESGKVLYIKALGSNLPLLLSDDTDLTGTKKYEYL